MYRTLVLATSFVSKLTKAAERLASLADKAATKADNVAFRVEAKAVEVREQQLEDNLANANAALRRAYDNLRAENANYRDGRMALVAAHPDFI